jgi:hypothetical protein
MDAHIRERADTFFKDYIDPEYREPFNRLCEAIARQEQKGEPYALFGSRTAVIEQIEALFFNPCQIAARCIVPVDCIA